jgi:DNA-binding PadR family transcriptional regulator
MFRQIHSRSLMPAWAEAELSKPFLMSERHGHGHGHGDGHGRGHKGSSGDGWGDEPRTRRGDIKFMLLELLSEHPQHGYELMKELEARSGGFRRISPGSIYPTLQMLEDGGYVTSEPADGKRVYTITPSGEQFLSERHPHPHAKGTRDSSTENKPAESIELRRTLTEVNDAVAQVARSGNLDRLTRVRDLLAQVKREIYKLLAEE